MNIVVTVSYAASEECRKILLQKGKTGEQDRVIDIEMPAEALDSLPIYVTEDGSAHLDLKEHHYGIQYEKIRNHDGFRGGTDACLCCHKPARATELFNPIFNYEDVLAFFKDEKERLARVQAILDQSIRDVAIKKAAYEEARDEIEPAIKRKYEHSFQKIEAIKALIQGKTRVRTVQIQDILNQS
jgi:cytochrome c551/c552